MPSKPQNATEFTLTCWHNMEVMHPFDWELTYATRTAQPGQCTFSDRRYERLKLQWRTVATTPNLEKLVAMKKNQDRDDEDTAPLHDSAPGWIGIVESVEKGAIVHAGRYFEDQRTLVEAIIIWPRPRRAKIDRRILESIRLDDGSAALSRWEAMGIRLELDHCYELKHFDSEAGRTSWAFGERNSKREPPLLVRRIGMPRYWLKQSIENWLVAEIPVKQRVLTRRSLTQNGHPAVLITSEGSDAGFKRLRGRRVMRADIAWLCDREDRVYHIHHVDTGRHASATIPETLTVRCCQPYHL